MTAHQSVLLQESLEALNIQENGIYMDATFGRGGHSVAMLKQLGSQGRLIAIDHDVSAVEEAKKLLSQDVRCAIHHASFAKIKNIAEQEAVVGKVKGILFDLGVSSPQLDTAERGFSFLRDGPLDMRMDQRHPLDAATWINTAKEEEIAQVLYQYGEERFSRRIAKKIVEARAAQPITRTLQLAQLIAEAHPAWEKHKHPATRSFQAIRIFINHELDALEQALKGSVEVLDKGGRVVIISFHSLEDRRVKQFLKKQATGEAIPAYIPLKTEDHPQQSMRCVVRKGIRPSKEEVAHNPRARSAILRIGEKIT